MKLFVIPFWLEKVLERERLPISTVQDYSKLSAILSKADVAFYMYIQDRRHVLLPADVVNTFNMSSPDLYKDCSAEIAELHQQYYMIYDAEYNGLPREDVIAQLIGSDRVGDKDANAWRLAYHPDILDEDTIVIRVRLEDGKLNSTHWVEFYDRLCSLFMLHRGFDALAKADVFKGYLKTIKPY